jgi:transposase-like protein
MTSPSVSCKRHRFPPAIIAHAVWAYFRFPLSLRLVKEMLHERGIVVSYETVRRRAIEFGRDYARRLKRKRASRCDIWHLGEVSSPSAASSICCGERSIRTDISLMKSSRRDATPRQQSAC